MKFNANVQVQAEVDALVKQLQDLAKSLGATQVGKLTLDPPFDNQGGAHIPFKFKGEVYEFSFTIDGPELENQNIDGMPTIQMVQLDSQEDGNLECCLTLEDLEIALKML